MFNEFNQLHPNIRIRILTSFLSRVIGSMIFPFMAIYFTKELDALYASVLIMIQVSIQFLFSFYGGYLADNFGRKRMMVIGEVLKSLGFLGMLVFNSPMIVSPWITFIMLLIVSISAGLVNPAAEAMLIDVSTKETRVFMYSLNYWAINFSLIIGLIVGGWLFETHLFELLFILFLMSLSTLTMTITLIKETSKVPIDQIKNKFYDFKAVILNYWTVLKDFPFTLFTLSGVGILTIEFQRNYYIAIRLEQEIPSEILFIPFLGEITLSGVKLLSLLTIENAILVILFSRVVSAFIKKKNIEIWMYIGFILFAIGYAMLTVSNSYLLLFISVIVFTLGELIFVPTRQSLLAEIVDSNRRGSYMAFNALIYQLGKFFAAFGIILGEKIGALYMSIHYMFLAIVSIFICSIALKMFRLKKVK